MADNTPIARVSAIQGQAFAKGRDGVLRPLHLNDTILEGEVIVTAEGGRVELAMADDRSIVMRANETLTVDAEVAATVKPDASDAALVAAGSDANKVIKAINTGGSLDELLDDTAAGASAGGADGGSSFVRLLRITESVDGQSFAFDPTQRDAGSSDFGAAASTAPAVIAATAPTAPTTAAPDTNTVAEDHLATGNVLANDSSAAGPLAVSQFVVAGETHTIPAGGTTTVTLAEVGTLAMSSDGSYVFTPVANWNGAVPTVSYTATDGTSSATSTLDINVAAVNDAPVANNDVLATSEDTPVTYTAAQLLVNDTDADGNALSIASVTSGNGGTAVLNSDGTVSFTPNANFNGAADFTYTVTDGNLTSNTATVTVNVAAVNDAPVVGSASATVSEGGLSGANLLSDATNATVATGQISISDADGSNVTVTLSAPPAGMFTSGGQNVVWTGGGTSHLVGKVGSTTILDLAIDNSGNYTVTLSGPVDQALGNGENLFSYNFGVNVSDGSLTTTNTLAVHIVDDIPVLGMPNSAIITETAGSVLTGNLNLSIGADATGAKVLFSGLQMDAAGNIMANQYNHSNGSAAGTGYLTYHDSKLHFVTAADGSLTAVDSNNTAVFTVSGDAATGQYHVSMLQTLDAGTTATTVFGTISGGNSGVYTIGSGSTVFEITATGTSSTFDKHTGAITGTVSDTVNTSANDFGVGSGQAIDYGDTLHFAFAAAGVSTTVTGIQFTADQLGSGETLIWKTYDAAGALLDSGTVAGAASAPTVTLGAADLSHGAFHSISFSADSGTSYKLALDSVTGHTQALDQLTTLGVTGIDGDGDASATQSISLTFDAATASLSGTSSDDALGDNGGAAGVTIAGGLGNDMLTGGNGADTLIGGQGSDSLTGGLGADTFKWQLGDGGTAGSPATDTITDFGTAAYTSGGDRLDLRDLLQGENHTAGTGNLDHYLHFEKSGTDTIVHVSSAGQFGSTDTPSVIASHEDQKIVLHGVDLTVAGTDQQIIQDLLTKGKLVTD